MILPTRDGDVQAVARPANPHGPWQTLPTWSLSGPQVTPEAALSLTSVYGAVTLIAQACGTMPLQVLDESKTGPERIVRSSRLSLMLNVEPNRDMTAIDLWTFVFASLCLRGNAYCAKLRDAQGYVNELYPIPPANVTVWRADDGRKLFRIRMLDGSRWVERDYDERSIWHVKAMSIDDPLVGVSPITMLRHRIGAQIAQSEHQARAYKNGLQLRGVLSTPATTLNPDSVKMMKAQWKAALDPSGDDIAFLHSGMSFQTVTMSLADAQFIQTMKWGHTETAIAFQLPPSRLAGDTGDSSRYANMAQDDLFVYKQAYLPRLEMVEAALKRDRDLFGPQSSWSAQFNPDKQLRADPRERWEIHRIRREIGAASTNDVRRDEDQPEIGAEGDDYTPLKSGGGNARKPEQRSSAPPYSDSDSASTEASSPPKKPGT